MEVMERYYLTKERLEELKKELEVLKTQKRLEVAEHLKRAKEYGDLSENSEYASAREEQSRVESRIQRIPWPALRVAISPPSRRACALLRLLAA